jgi:spore coat-associated protein N
MKRVSALWQASPRKVVGALFILMMASLMAVASGASFTSTSANNGNVVAAGVMTQDNSKAGSAILNVHGLVPGHSANGTVTLKNTGDADGVFTLSESNVADSDSTNPLSAKVDLVVTDTSTGNNVYTGKLGAMPASAAGTIAKGASHTYDFTVTFPDGGKPADASSGDNVYQNGSATVDFGWESVSQ